MHVYKYLFYFTLLFINSDKLLLQSISSVPKIKHTHSYIYILIRYWVCQSVCLCVCSCAIETTFPLFNFKTKHIFGILMAQRKI